MRQALKFASDLGLWSIALIVGATLIGVAIYAIWQKRRELAALALLLPLGTGLIFAGGAFAGMHERHGWAGAAALGALFALLLAALFAPIPARFTERSTQTAPVPANALPRSAASRLAAAAGPLALGFAYALAQSGSAVPGFERRQLGLVLTMEFLVLHSVALLGVIALLRTGYWRAEVLRWYLFACLFLFYVAAAYRHSADAAVLFLIAAFGTYGGLMGRVRSADAPAQLAKRWVLAFAAFFAAAIALRMPEAVERWDRAPQAMYFGMLYFALLAAAECSGIYERRWLRKEFWRRDRAG